MEFNKWVSLLGARQPAHMAASLGFLRKEDRPGVERWLQAENPQWAHLDEVNTYGPPTKLLYQARPSSGSARSSSVPCSARSSRSAPSGRPSSSARPVPPLDLDARRAASAPSSSRPSSAPGGSYFAAGRASMDFARSALQHPYRGSAPRGLARARSTHWVPGSTDLAPARLPPYVIEPRDPVAFDEEVRACLEASWSPSKGSMTDFWNAKQGEIDKTRGVYVEQMDRESAREALVESRVDRSVPPMFRTTSTSPFATHSAGVTSGRQRLLTYGADRGSHGYGMSRS